MNQNIKEKSVTALLWSAVDHFSAQGLGLIITIVIARLITPADYGILAMLSIFMAISTTIINSGFSNYLIQKKDSSATDFSTVFFLNVAMGVACYVLLFIASPFIASFYSQPILSEIIKVYCLALIISSLTLTQRAKLYIDNKFKRLSIITIGSLILAGTVAVILANNGFGVWALVWYYLLQVSVSSLLIWITTNWYPSAVFSKASAKEAYAFGSKLLVANFLSNAVANIYTLVIGKKFQASELGLYSRGQSLASVFPINMSSMLQQATYPILCQLQNDPERLKRLFINYIRTSAMICFPLMTLLIVLADPIVRVILTDKWLPSVVFIQVLGIGYMFDPIMRLNSIILSVTGKTKYSLSSEVWKKVTMLVVLFTSLPFGIYWVAIGATLYCFIDLMIVTRYVKNIIPISLREEIRVILPFLIYCVFVYFVVAIGKTFVTNSSMQLTVFIPIGCVIYLLMARSFSKTSYSLVMDNLKTLFKKSNNG